LSVLADELPAPSPEQSEGICVLAGASRAAARPRAQGLFTRM